MVLSDRPLLSDTGQRNSPVITEVSQDAELFELKRSQEMGLNGGHLVMTLVDYLQLQSSLNW